MAETIVLAGSLAQKPGYGGHTWVFLQYILGFKRLGWDVLFLDRLEPEMCIDADNKPCPLEESLNLRYFMEVVEGFGLRNAFALLYNRGEQVIGLSRPRLIERVRNSAFLLDVMGYLDDEEILGCAPRRVFLDIDPGFGQMWRDLELADLFQGYNDYVTIGENIGRPECEIPTCGLEWITTPQPVILDHWQPIAAANNGCFTSIGAWRGPYGPVEYRGKTYGLRVHEFRNFAPLPQLTGQPFQVALDIHSAEARDIEMLTTSGWSLVDPQGVAGDPWAYQAYIQNSKAEFMTAKNMYVQTNSGWFSDRSICYLVCGKPVLAQDTGIGHLYPAGEGLLTFSTLEEAAAGVDEISGNYARHSRAARALAEEYFDSDRVLSQLLGKLGVA